MAALGARGLTMDAQRAYNGVRNLANNYSIGLPWAIPATLWQNYSKDSEIK